MKGLGSVRFSKAIFTTNQFYCIIPIEKTNRRKENQ